MIVRFFFPTRRFISPLAKVMWGSTGGHIVTITALFATFGALNGWILLQGQVPLARPSRSPPKRKVKQPG